MKNINKPKILKGTRDFGPKQMAKRQFVLGQIRYMFETFGYDTIETPAIEYADTILGKYGEEGNKLTYTFKDNGGRNVALRYDQTVPFARYVAMNYPDLPMPFKRYQISRVWRADKPAKGRYREFYQCDIDIIGTTDLLAEAEIARVIVAVYTKLGIKNFKIKINNRRFMNSILNRLGIPEELQTQVLRAIDKLDKIGREGVTKELKTIVDGDTMRNLFDVIFIRGTNQEKLVALSSDDTDEIQQFLELCTLYGVEEKFLEFDTCLARGLDYYTGMTYEVVIDGIDVGTVCGGGRYDNLCEQFCDKQFSGVGVAFGFDRTIIAMEELGLLNDISLNTKILVTRLDDVSMPYSLSITTMLQIKNINTEIYPESVSLKKQLKYANKKNIPFVLMCGLQEQNDQTVIIKIMGSGKQKTIPRSQLVEYLNGALKREIL